MAEYGHASGRRTKRTVVFGPVTIAAVHVFDTRCPDRVPHSATYDRRSIGFLLTIVDGLPPWAI